MRAALAPALGAGGIRENRTRPPIRAALRPPRHLRLQRRFRLGGLRRSGNWQRSRRNHRKAATPSQRPVYVCMRTRRMRRRGAARCSTCGKGVENMHSSFSTTPKPLPKTAQSSRCWAISSQRGLPNGSSSSVRAARCRCASAHYLAPHQMLTISQNELRFEPDEAVTTFRRFRTPARHVNRIVRLADGWPIVLMLLALFAQYEANIEHLLDRLSGIAPAGRYEYLANELLAAFTPDMLATMLTTAAIPNASLEDISAATGIRHANRPRRSATGFTRIHLRRDRRVSNPSVAPNGPARAARSRSRELSLPGGARIRAIRRFAAGRGTL